MDNQNSSRPLDDFVIPFSWELVLELNDPRVDLELNNNPECKFFKQNMWWCRGPIDCKERKNCKFYKKALLALMELKL